MKRTWREECWRHSLVAILFSLASCIGWGQANRATITGTVTDTTGAVISEVSVTVTNTGTNVITKTVTNQEGIYVVPNLFPGQYSVQFERDGFETLLRPSVTLNSTEVARIDAGLKVGSASATVTVTSDAPVLDLETASEGTNMKAEVVNDLPLSIYGGGRFLEDFAVAITPGYSPISSPYGAVVNGGQWFVKEYTIDGTSGTANIRGDSMDGGPSMEAVEELQAQTSGLDAQSSMTGGGVMSFNLKSGTNALHGSGFLYGHNELLDANTWTNDYYGERKPKERAWDFGFSLGGPIHKDKTFFFGTFERFVSQDFRLNSGGASVPTTAFLNGDFSALLGGGICTFPDGSTDLCSADPTSHGGSGAAKMVYNTAGQQVQAQQNMIYDPTSQDPNGSVEQFTGNVIPSNRISGVAQKVNEFYKNYAPQSGGIDNNARTLLSNTPSQTPNQYVVKLDHVLREQDHLSGSWIYNHRLRTLDDSGGLWQAGSTSGGPLSNARIQKYTDQQWRASEQHTFSPNLLNVANYTYSFDWNGSIPAETADWNSQVGFGDTGSTNFPLISFSDNSAYGHSETFIGSTWQGDTSGVNATIGDTLTWSKGRHNMSFGGDFVAHQVNSHSGKGALSFTFNNNNTSGLSPTLDGFAFATYELGLVNNASESVPYNLYGRQKGLALFAQDSYKITPRLTANLGLRWNFNTRFKEKNGNWANFDLSQIDPNYNEPGKLVFATGGGDSFEKEQYYANFGPSLGIAYQVLPSTVFRASFGLIFNPVGVAFDTGVPDQFAPQLGSSSASNFSWDGASGGGNYPGVVTKATTSTDPTTMRPFPVSVDPRALRLGYTEAFNVGLQQQLTPNTKFELSYVGNRGHRLTDTALAWNETSASKFVSLLRANPGMSIWDYSQYIWGPSDAAAYGVPYPYTGFWGPPLAAIAPMPQMAAAAIDYDWYYNIQYVGLPLGQSFYDSMVLDLTKRAGRGLTMDLSYVWSRQEGNSYSAQQDYNGYYTPVQDFGNMRQAAHALTGYDLTHVVKGFAEYELPLGKGKPWLGSQGPIVNGIVSGWTVAATLNYYTGQPFRVGAANPYWPLWGNIYPQFNLAGYKGPNSTKHFVPIGASGQVPDTNIYMPSTVASNPSPGVLPPSPYTSKLRCPGGADENTSVMKNEHVGPDGKYRISFRADFYNLFNRHFYNIEGCSGSSASIGAANFGEILGVQDNPRQGQFSIRLDF